MAYQPKHKGFGRWFVVEGDRDVSGPYKDKPAAEAEIARLNAAAPSGAVSLRAPAIAPEAKAAAAGRAAEKARQQDKHADFLSEREASRRTDAAQRFAAAALFDDLRAAVLKHAGEDAAYRCETELRAIATDPKREARRRQRLREVDRHGRDPALPIRAN